jgi:hypothetical protein
MVAFPEAGSDAVAAGDRRVRRSRLLAVPKSRYHLQMVRRAVAETANGSNNVTKKQSIAKIAK